MGYFCGFALFCWLSFLPLHAATVVLEPVADTSLTEIFPTNNLGGAKFVLVGTGENLTFHRAVMAFDITNNISPGSRIRNATLLLEVTKDPANGFAASSFELHRLLKSWGEGNKISPTNCTSCAGFGAPATLGEATWESRFTFTTNVWSVPGAEATNDYVAEISSDQFIYGIAFSPYNFDATPRLLADVQLWLDSPELNFGWLIKSASEEVAFTARRIGSREDSNASPLLTIEFTPPPLIQNVRKNGAQVSFTFLAEGGQSYAVETRNAFSTGNPWTTLTNIPAPVEATNLLFNATISASQQFFRVVAP